MIETERLLLRGWRPADVAARHAIACDPRVVATLGPAPSPTESAARLERQAATLATYGYCFRAVEEQASGALIGWCGLQPGPAPIAPLTEIGWTLTPERWGEGLAREAAAAVLAWAWANTALDRLVAITTPGNVRSWGLMERLGMARVPGGDFDHPALPIGHPLRRHLTYAIERP